MELKATFTVVKATNAAYGCTEWLEDDLNFVVRAKVQNQKP